MPKGRATRPIHQVRWLVGLAFVIGLLAGGEIWRSYRQATSAAERSVAGLVRLLAEQTERTIQAIDFTLIGMRDAIIVAPNLTTSDPAYKAALKERLESLPYVRSLFVVGPDGFATHDSGELHETSLADRPYFQAHRADRSLGLRIGRPLRSVTTDGWFISMSRRISNADGSFGGVVVAAVEPRYFKRFYEDISIGDGSVIAMHLTNGTLLAHMPHHDETIGTVYADSPIIKLAAVRSDGVVWVTSPIDGTRRVVGYRTLSGGSILVLAGWSARTVYDAWVGHIAVVGGASILVWVLAAGLTLLWAKSRRREQMEQARLAQVQRLETMGRIAGGIAHDLGNTVKIARTTFTLLRPSLASQQDAMALVDDADRSLKSAFDIIDRLLAFARRQELSPRATDLGALISGFAPILRQAVGPRIDLDLDVSGCRPLVCVIDTIHLESALLNLVLNSKDAMPGGGRIVIALREVQAPRRRNLRRARQSPTPPWAEIAVKDTGAGMSRHVLERAFEPFFTTRTGGSGLGLSQVLGFVKQSAGDVRIESRKGAGTMVSLLFPIADDAPILAHPAGSAGPSSAA